MTTTSLFHSILQWLRAGYPEGVPGPDRVPLLALLRATPLTEDQVKEVVRNLTDADAGRWPTARSPATRSRSSSPTSPITTRARRTSQRVAAKLAAAGWPLAGINDRLVARC